MAAAEPKLEISISSALDQKTLDRTQKALEGKGITDYDPTQNTTVSLPISNLDTIDRKSGDFLSTLAGSGAVKYVGLNITPLKVKNMTPEYLVPMVLFREGCFSIGLKLKGETLINVKIPYALNPKIFPHPKPSSKWTNRAPLTGTEVLLATEGADSLRQKWKWVTEKPVQVAWSDETHRITILVTLQRVLDTDGEPLLYFVDRVWGAKQIAVFFDESLLKT